ncbi:hypothetical protein E2C01_082959 [Portunus trituberculatus]|uniref:Uncharacterized protein n=1 Tax=Portunus trituberculatus TaxID=210409 RepID=A0A5B7J0G8_PORTR|nr:hypothetical protein [Portunus trituberculatus]
MQVRIRVSLSYSMPQHNTKTQQSTIHFTKLSLPPHTHPSSPDSRNLATPSLHSPKSAADSDLIRPLFGPRRTSISHHIIPCDERSREEGEKISRKGMKVEK